MTILAVKPLRAPLGEQLVADGLISPEQLQQALDQQRQTRSLLGETLVTLGFMTAADIGPYLEAATGFPFVDIAETSIDIELARLIPENLARRKVLLPYAEEGDEILVAMADPLDLAAVDDLRARLNRKIEPCLAFQADLQEAINRIYDVKTKTLSVLDEIATVEVEKDLTVDELVGMAEDAPIVRLVNTIVRAATAAGASDIHIEPQEDVVRVRFRQDGLLTEQMTIPRQHLAAVVSRIKVMSQLNIAERRRAQDGRFMVKDDNGCEFDMRVSIMPVIFGEKVVMRVLAKSSQYGRADKLGFFPEQREVFEKFIQRPHGIILVTGPTGSGKSTTLFAALNQINDSTRNINTVEDPVEYNLPGVNQVQVNPKIGVTFAAGLRTLVRQDPDVIMVGEIRDAETAEISVQAALTGHLVFSTLHTNDAPGALVRLQNMGVEPFLISSAVIGVLAQRLLRTVCPFCKETYRASNSVVAAFGLPLDEEGQPPLLTRGTGCTKCGGRGMKGRTAVYEIMPMSETLRDMVLKRCSGDQLKQQAAREGMIAMRDSAIRKVLEGVTTPGEVMRVLFAEE